MIVEARKAGDGRSVMKLMKMKKNLPDEAGAAPQAPPAVVPQPVPVVQQPAPVQPHPVPFDGLGTTCFA